MKGEEGLALGTRNREAEAAILGEGVWAGRDSTGPKAKARCGRGCLGV